MRITCKDFVKLFDVWADIIEENKDYLIKLDSVGGDGDLGLAMSDGFGAIQKMLAEKQFEDVGVLMYNAGKTMSIHAPSSLGTLLAFGFMEVGKTFRDRADISGMELAAFLEAFEGAIVARGKASLGEKTFLDGFDPATQTMKAVRSEEVVPAALHTAAKAAYEGSQSTIQMVAKHGRIAVRGEGSKGIIDPGSVVAALLVQGLADALAPEK